MTDIVQIALIAGIPPTLAGIGTLVVSLRNSQKADDAKVTVDKIIENTETVTKKADEIHVLVNSNMTEIKAKLAASEARVLKLEELLTLMTSAKSGR